MNKLDITKIQNIKEYLNLICILGNYFFYLNIEKWEIYPLSRAIGFNGTCI